MGTMVGLDTKLFQGMRGQMCKCMAKSTKYNINSKQKHAALDNCTTFLVEVDLMQKQKEIEIGMGHNHNKR